MSDSKKQSEETLNLLENDPQLDHIVDHQGVKIYYTLDDIPEHFPAVKCVAIDTEAMGLNQKRDPLCLVQLCTEARGVCYLIKIRLVPNSAPRLVKMLQDEKVAKLFHFARFDVHLLQETFKIRIRNIHCTKIMSKMARTYTNYHNLKELCKQILDVEVGKTQGSSDWGHYLLSNAQKVYAAKDVYYLHEIYRELETLLRRENRWELYDETRKSLENWINLEQNHFAIEYLWSHSSLDIKV